jgi:hypothetical protein
MVSPEETTAAKIFDDGWSSMDADPGDTERNAFLEGLVSEFSAYSSRARALCSALVEA